MTQIQDLIRTEFHDSYLEVVDHETKCISLVFENVSFVYEEYFLCTVTLIGVESVTRDDISIPKMEREGEGGSVIAFILNPTSAELVLNWNFAPRRYETRAYTFQFERFEMKAEPAPPP